MLISIGDQGVQAVGICCLKGGSGVRMCLDEWADIRDGGDGVEEIAVRGGHVASHFLVGGRQAVS